MKYYNKKHIPNIISCFRFLFAILIVIFLFLASNAISNSFFNYQENFHKVNFGWWIAAGVIFVIAALSDYVDGYLARKWDVVSDFGKFFDPLTDKIVVNLTSLMLVIFFKNMFPFYILIIFFLRDYAVDGLRLFFASKKNKVIAAKTLGKLKTVSQMFAISLIFFIFPLFTHNSIAIQYLYISLYIALIFSVVSGIVYFYKALYTKPNLVSIINNKKQPGV